MITMRGMSDGIQGCVDRWFPTCEGHASPLEPRTGTVSQRPQGGAAVTMGFWPRLLAVDAPSIEDMSLSRGRFPWACCRTVRRTGWAGPYTSKRLGTRETHW